jgi:phosphatidate cytidylyltransferase
MGFVAVILIDEMFLAPWYPLWMASGLVFVLVAGHELCNLLAATGVKPSTNTVLGGVSALLLANWVPHLEQALSQGHQELPIHAQMVMTVHALAWPLLAFVGVLMVAFLTQSVQFSKPGGTMATLGASILAVAYVGLLGTFVIQLRWVGGPYHGMVAVIMLMATAKGADIGAYTIGRLAGQHKLWPSLSPNKTIEGAVGGLLVAVLAATFIAELGRRYVSLPMTMPAAIGFGLLVGTAAQLGDLMESMIKRDCERKDASDTLPGFGGVLDVIDSVLFAAPVAYGYWMMLGP